MHFAHWISKQRIDAGLLQKELAHQLGVTRTTVTKWENGKSRPDYETITDIITICHSSSDDILYFFKKNKATS